MVAAEHAVIEGLGIRIAQCVVELEYQLTEEEINAMPAIRERFAT